MKTLFCQMCHNFGFIVLISLVAVLSFSSQAFAETDSDSDTGNKTKSSNEGTVITAKNSTNSTIAMDTHLDKNDDDKGSSNAGLIAGVVVPIIIIIAVVVVLFIIHKRRSRMMDNEKKMKIQMTSARNAGVYQDLTVTVPADAEKPPASPEHERLQSTEEA